MNELGLLPRENKVYFGQLLGMCDQISFPLGESRTSKHTLTQNHNSDYALTSPALDKACWFDSVIPASAESVFAMLQMLSCVP